MQVSNRELRERYQAASTDELLQIKISSELTDAARSLLEDELSRRDVIPDDYENARNDILSLERGELPMPSRYDEHTYLIKKLVHRTKQADFKYLPEQIQQNFAMKIEAHESLEAEKQLDIQRAQAGFIPTGGYLVKVDFYISTGEGKTKRATLPYEAVQWLIDKLKGQGMAQEQLETMQQGAVAEIANKVTEGQASPQIQGAI